MFLKIYSTKGVQWIVDQKKLFHIVPIEDAFIEVSVFNVATGADLGTRRLPATWLKEDFRSVSSVSLIHI